MDKEKQRIAIAEACGWEIIAPPHVKGDSPYWNDPSGHFHGGGSHNPLPDYLSDLNAMHEAENTLNQWRSVDYVSALASVILIRANLPHDGYCGRYPLMTAPADVRAEAFLRTLNLWNPTREENE